VEIAAGGGKFPHGMIVPFNSNAAISQDRVPDFLVSRYDLQRRTRLRIQPYHVLQLVYQPYLNTWYEGIRG
jgi:hypothetical protein